MREVLEAMTYLCNSDEHVFDEALNCASRCDIAFASEPNADSDKSAFSFWSVLLHLLQFACQVSEVLGHRSTLAFNRQDSALAGDVDALWHFKPQLSHQSSHFA
jgi:hypothetical protein